ncbi:MAG: amidohydrolase family protein [Bacillota bacterium]
MALQGVRVIDAHVHFPAGGIVTARVTPASSYAARFGEEKAKKLATQKAKAQARWRRMYGFPDPEMDERTPAEQAERWAGEVDKYGLDRVVFVTGGGNDTLAGAVRQHPDKFIGFAHHSPFGKGAAEELERAITKLGFRGYKIGEGVLIGSPPLHDPSVYPVWEVAEEHEIPVLIHFGPSGGVGGTAVHGNINPLMIHDVAKAFPGIPFIVPHFGCGYPTQLLQLCWACENVYVDTSGSNEWVRWMMPDINLEDLFRKFLQTIGSRRILFGTDSFWFPRGFAVAYFEEQMRICRRLNVPEAGIRDIFAGNAARLLKL